MTVLRVQQVLPVDFGLHAVVDEQVDQDVQGSDVPHTDRLCELPRVIHVS
jgi:hypothetical protein